MSRITITDYDNPVMALQLVKLDQQEAAYIETRETQPTLSDPERHDLTMQYVFRAHLQDELAGIATNPDTANAHRATAETCRRAGAAYAETVDVAAVSAA